MTFPRFFIATATIALAMLSSCSAPVQPSPERAALPADAPNVLTSLHLRLEIAAETGTVTYFGGYDGRRNLLGPGGITSSLVGMEPAEMRGGIVRVSKTELRYAGIDQNGIVWEKSWKIDDTTAQVALRITSKRGDGFDAIIYSLADLPDARISGDNRDLHISTPQAEADFHAFIVDPHFPGEQMSPYAMRSDSKRLEPGESMEFRMSWSLKVARMK